MASSGYYTTGNSNWRFKYTVDVGSPSGQTYPFTYKFYLYRPNSSSYYWGAKWIFSGKVNGTSWSYNFHEPNKINVPAKTDVLVKTYTVNVNISNYSVSARSITVSAGFSDNGSGVSPYSSNGGSITVSIPANASGV